MIIVSFGYTGGASVTTAFEDEGVAWLSLGEGEITTVDDKRTNIVVTTLVATEELVLLFEELALCNEALLEGEGETKLVFEAMTTKVVWFDSTEEVPKGCEGETERFCEAVTIKVVWLDTEGVPKGCESKTELVCDAVTTKVVRLDTEEVSRGCEGDTELVCEGVTTKVVWLDTEEVPKGCEGTGLE